MFRNSDDDKDGFITAAQARVLFVKSALSPYALAKIWYGSSLEGEWRAYSLTSIKGNWQTWTEIAC